MRFAICNEMFEEWKIGEVFRYAKEVGYDGVEVAPFTLAESVALLSDDDRNRIRREAEDAGVAIVGLHWLLVSPKGLYITHPDRAIREKTERYFVDLVHCCADLGGDRMILGSPRQRSLLEGVSYEQAWGYARECLRNIAPAAEDRGVTLCFEALAPAETNFVNTAAEAIRLVQEVDSPNVRIVLDAKAMSSETIPIPEIIRRSRGWVAHVHANDPNLRGPGFGDLDFRPIAAALRDIGYDGWISVEVFDFKVDPRETATRSLAYLRDVFRTG
jgi:sugar phosphate isomerase/epimerase